jgi:hypothetical protein
MKMENEFQEDIQRDQISDQQQTDEQVGNEPEYLVEYDGPDGNPVRLTGEDVIGRLTENLNLQEQLRSLQEQIETEKTQPAQLQQFQQQQQQPSPDPVQQQEQEAQQTLEAFANGDMTVIPQILGYMKQAAMEAARAEVSSGFTQNNRERAFIERFPESRGLMQDQNFQKYAQVNGHVFSDGVQAAIAYMGEQKTAAMQKEIDALKAQIATATKTAKSQGEKEALQKVKANGTFRLVNGGSSRAQGNGKPTANDPDDPAGMKALLAQLRGVDQIY